MDDTEAREIFFARRTDKTIFSRSFVDTLSGQKLRIASHVVDGSEGLRFAHVKDEVILRTTPAQRFQIKATLLEDDRSIKVLTIQRYSHKHPLEQSFSFVDGEIDVLLKFAMGVRAIPFQDDSKLHVSDDALNDVVLNEGQARTLFSKHEALFTEIATNQVLQRDIVAVGYRRKQIKEFEDLLNNRAYFTQEQRRLQTTPEGVWQKFFEANTWIFGYGLSYQFISRLNARKLEQVVRGHDVVSTGKRSDALMKTRGIISSLCFIEIKRADTPLLAATQYRPGVWAPSTELVGGVSQVQTTVNSAVQTLGQKLLPEDDFGVPTGEELFNIEPRSCLVVGSLNQFETEQGVNVSKFKSFELYRRHTWRPEIITFDELLQRARFIVEHKPDAKVQFEDSGDFIPF